MPAICASMNTATEGASPALTFCEGIYGTVAQWQSIATAKYVGSIPTGSIVKREFL